ncbi:MAG: sigma-54-dependent Fis family transcriptional regulator [Myxococcales bacterium]|nr:sigma-54-dependent Fis family transcriptional regulator [Myxococcales bacterium]
MTWRAPGDLTDEQAWRALARLLGRLRAVAYRPDWLEECLDALVVLLEVDRAFVVVHGDGGDHVVEARGTRGRVSAEEHREVSATMMREARRTRTTVRWEIGDDGPSESLAHHGIVAAVAVPLHPVGGEGPTMGSLYLDYRVPRRRLDATALDLLTAVADLVAVLLDRQRALREAHHALDDARRDDVGPSLDALLEPASMASLRAEVASLGESTPVLVTGESGTGKTLLCRAIAKAGRRRPIVRALLGASDDLNTITSELFGHERGAFSGASTKRVGLVEQAHGGTLILDEVLSLPAHAQQLLLDVTQFGTYRPLGWTGREPKRADLRILAATNGDLDRAMAEGRFRSDLFYRLAGAHLRLPPLRARRAEIAGLAQGMLARLDPDRSWRLSLSARERLADEELSWPGNLRQLQRVIERARDRALADDADADVIDVSHLAIEAPAASSADRSPATLDRYGAVREARARLDEEERRLIESTLDAHAGVVTRAARELGLPRTSLLSRMETLGIAKGPRRAGTGT